jgi:tetratricopeptide (TPR) repeat protein
MNYRSAENLGFFTSRELRVVLVGILVLVCLSSDGGGGRPGAPLGPPTSAPPIDSQDSLHLVHLALQRGHGRRALAGFAQRLSSRPADIQAGLGIVEAAARVGADRWLADYLKALRRRSPTAAVWLATAEMAYRRGDLGRGVRAAERANRNRPDEPVIAYSYAAGKAAAGDLLGALALVGDLALDGAGARTSASTSGRAARLDALVDPQGRGRRSALSAWAETRRQGEPLGQVRSLLLLSMIDRVAGDEKGAMGFARQALRIAIASGDPSVSGLALMGLGQVEHSPPELRLSRLIAACHGLWDLGPSARADCQLLSMKAAWDAGRIELGLGLFRSVAKQVGRNPILELELAAQSLSLLQGAGRMYEAAQVSASAAQAARRLSQPMLQAHYLVRLAGLRRILGDPIGADRAALQAIEVAPEGARSLLARAFGERAEVAWAMGNESLAVQLFAHAEELSSSDPDPLVAARRVRHAVEGAGTTNIETSFPDTSLDVRSPSGIRGTPARIIELASRGHSREAGGDLDGAWRDYRAALEMFSAWLADLDDPIVRIHLLDTWRQMSRRAATVALGLGQASWALDAIELGRRIPDSQQGTSTWSELAQHLSGGSIVVTFVVGPQQVWAIVLSEGELRATLLPITPEILRDQAELWRTAASTVAPDDLWWRIGERLSAVLVAPLERLGYLAGAEVIYVVPDDALHLIPLASLPRTGSRDEVYGDRHVWARVPSLSALDAAWHQRPRRGSLVAFGQDGGADTIAELRAALGDRVGSFLLGPRASENALRKAARNAAIIHFAGHAVVPSPDLTGGGLRLRADSTADGRISIGEILDLDVRGASVVLLGCDTATRPVSPAHGSGPGDLLSLSEAFLLAGARSVVGNLWPVTEQAGRRLAVSFYAHGGPMEGAKSLALARRELRRRWPDRPDWWAGAVWEGFAGPTVVPGLE